ncbi:MAG TPA: hypothetical protein VFG16_28050, partial [Streptomyces sp.]|nr:hypothetical protein [Streptomyces sp.]
MRPSAACPQTPDGRGHPHIALSFALPAEDAYEAYRSITARQAGTAFGALRAGPADLAAGAERAAAEHAA